MDDLIPFLILVAISIVGAVARKKKKSPFTDDVPNVRQEPHQDDFLSWMERIADNKPEPIPYGAQKPEEDEEPDEAVAVTAYEGPGKRQEQYASYSGFISPAEKEQMMQKEAARSIVKEVTDDLTSQTIKNGEIGRERGTIDFDLKRAVIFSEVLNRKYS